VVATNNEEWLNRSQYNPQREGQPRSHVCGSARWISQSRFIETYPKYWTKEHWCVTRGSWNTSWGSCRTHTTCWTRDTMQSQRANITPEDAASSRP